MICRILMRHFSHLIQMPVHIKKVIRHLKKQSHMDSKCMQKVLFFFTALCHCQCHIHRCRQKAACLAMVHEL